MAKFGPKAATKFGSRKGLLQSIRWAPQTPFAGVCCDVVDFEPNVLPKVSSSSFFGNSRIFVTDLLHHVDTNPQSLTPDHHPNRDQSELPR
ncbi:hypothetical protein MPTK1_6g04990 [Marchantia polymorpha subsp. ruderalis]|uniref:Uncharacterized protein n=2 Tax=Marchantia polymorpha TaxID=3197 RepID=A0AAF6BNN4_MARPO|nr:hypothetical protein MARPO_0034s0019 [Marchantia polymorpha]BBN13618.1 hypothetical protein Mp_6g04990 [Marchantia polymorpha subsp. ruderalis]|eukprot:PTQ41411.1 hypothetical protein MARPO_0034s0019 [Marchantia polymorpha]